ncbi:MAG: hypothetical protein RLZZ316_1318 [Bacteroidota bacterium]
MQCATQQLLTTALPPATQKITMSQPNKLINETSPYLLQHAYNPVQWHPWGEEALTLAKDKDKVILVSIGYSACHWCHVMERESFEDADTAAIMNENFINIKIDREERPDLDHIYMDALQAMSGQGGWPLNVFLTPDKKPFYGGTYFPPQRVHNRPSWKEVLEGVSHAYLNKRDAINAQAESLTQHLVNANNFGINTKDTATENKEELIHRAFDNIIKAADTTEGGFGHAPKFPQTFTIQFLLRYYHFYKNKAALQQATLSIDKMLFGGIYDQVGGGLARYATDNEWLVPHFEKMLYDNALFVTILSEAYQVTGDIKYKEGINATIDFLLRELTNAEGGFYAAIDADSEGEEGRYYVWTKTEVEKLLGQNAEWFCQLFDVTLNGNWEGVSILNKLGNETVIAAELGITVGVLEERIADAKKILLQAREKRVRPGLDDKLILGWNALMNTALSKAFAATQNEFYRELAIRNMQYLLSHFKSKNGASFYHSYKNKEGKSIAFLDDYALLIQACIHLQEITGDGRYLYHAKELAEYVELYFSEAETGFFFYTSKEQVDVIFRKKEVYDGAMPSGNAVMAGNLNYLGHVFDKGAWQLRALKMMKSVEEPVSRYPVSFGVWANNMMLEAKGWKEIVISGRNFNELLKGILHIFMPNKILQSATLIDKGFPLLAGKTIEDEPMIYLCKNSHCNTPVNTLQELVQQLEN